MTDGQNLFACTADDIDESAGMKDLALCTLDDQCQAEPDFHLPGCPVELELQDEFGF